MGRVTHYDTVQMMTWLLAQHDETKKPLTLTAVTAGTKVTLTKIGSPPAVSLEYSTGGAWSTYTIGTEIALASVGSYVSFRGDNVTFSAPGNDYYQFVMSGSFAASGNVMSLVDSTCWSLRIPCDNCFQRLFYSSLTLVTAPLLPATALTAACYYNMFFRSGITAPPVLPATVMMASCYQSMFQFSAITTPPILPALSLGTSCYQSMLASCSGMGGRVALPATMLYPNCYLGMLANCSELDEIDVSFGTWGSCTGWALNLAASGTFTKPVALPETFGNDYIPAGWTVINK